MCGRTACSLCPEDISRLCRYKRKDGKSENPQWDKSKDNYKPGYNKAPQSYCPVIISGKHLDDAVTADTRELAAMKWGLIPQWFKGDSTDKVTFIMNNARSDTLLEKRSYKIPLRKGQRCVVVAEGFYEWHKTTGGKQPFYIYFPLSDAVKSEKKYPQVLTMAGIFEKTYLNKEDVYSFTIITVNASSEFEWLHHRMPAMLETEDEIAAWLDYENVSLDEAIALIEPKNCLEWHPVSKYVSNSRHEGPQCVERVNLEDIKRKRAPESKQLMKWLQSSPSSLSNKDLNISPKKKKRLTALPTLDSWVKKKPKNKE